MLKQIQNFENQNLREQIRQIATGSFSKVQEAIKDPSQSKKIKDDSFQSALKGISSGIMAYENDPLLPILQNEMKARIAHFKGLSAEEEGKLLSLSSEQRRIIADSDRKSKSEYLAAPPNINNPGVKSHEKYKQYVDAMNASQRGDVKKH